nr:ABC transporter G family member 35-like [Tanacetum cinerariifolium]
MDDDSNEFNKRGLNFLPEVPDPDAKIVNLKHQTMDERKNVEEWMVDFALQQAVTTLSPARKIRVSLLVETFEKVPPIPKFFKHLLLVFLIQLVAGGLFRLIAAVYKTMNIANTEGSLILMLIFLLGGFILPKSKIPSWWTSKKSTDNSTRLGFSVLKSMDVPTSESSYWIGATALLGFALLFIVLFTVALVYLEAPGKPQAIISKEEPAAAQGLGGETQQIKPTGDANGKSNKGMVLPFTPLAMSFGNTNYFVEMPGEMKEQGVTKNRLQLLRDVTATFRPGVLTALMGVSGAGKTTLMDVLAGRKTSVYIEGDIRISRFPKLSSISRMKSARQKMLFVDQVMELVELENIKDAIVGLLEVTELSTKQRKRLTITVELVANPSIIFMDEPTSGLDARAAAIVIRAVRNIVDIGRTIVCTIHQPMTAAKFFWLFFINFFSFLYFTYFGMMTVSITPNDQIATIFAAGFYLLFNTSQDFISHNPKFPNGRFGTTGSAPWHGPLFSCVDMAASNPNPNGWTWEYQPFGRIVGAFIANKQSKQGKRFNFIRETRHNDMKSVKSVQLDECDLIKVEDASMVVMVRVKEIDTISNMYHVCRNEGFDDIKIHHIVSNDYVDEEILFNGKVDPIEALDDFIQNVVKEKQVEKTPLKDPKAHDSKRPGFETDMADDEVVSDNFKPPGFENFIKENKACSRSSNTSRAGKCSTSFGIMLDGVWNTEPKDIKLAFLDFYKDKFSFYNSTVSFLPMLLDHHLSIADWDFLESMVSMDEIKAVVWDCGSQKALGLDGYSLIFIKKFWDLLKHDI